MKPSFLIIILLVAAGLVAACGNITVQPAPVAAESAAPAATPTLEPAPPTAEPQANSAAPPVEKQAESAIVDAPPVILALEPQLSNENAVMVEVTPLNLPGGRPTLDFEVAFNTHSVDLGFDPAAISVLRDDQGREYPAIAWDGVGPGGHHRSGVLHFEPLESVPQFVELVIHDVAGVPERVFHWDLSQP